MRAIHKFHLLDHGMKAGRYLGQHDVRCYRPPWGYNATADLIDIHPITGAENNFPSRNGGYF